MNTTKLRRVGGSIMLAVPPAILDLLHLKAGSTVDLAIDGERLIVKAQDKPRYTLTELLEASDFSASPTDDEREWIDAPAVGGELL